MYVPAYKNKYLATVDGQRLSEDIQKAIDSLNKEGYEVICISEVTSGAGGSVGNGILSGHGYSYTEGVNIIAKFLKNN